MRIREQFCSHQGCPRRANDGIGWGRGTGVVLWFCTAHYLGALVRLAGLVRVAERRAAEVGR